MQYNHNCYSSCTTRRCLQVSRLLLLLLLLLTSCTPEPSTSALSAGELPPMTVRGAQLRAGGRPFEVRGVNYLRPSTDDPVVCPRLQFGADGNCPWDLPAIQSDLDQLQALGVNSLRLFLNFYVFGGAQLTDPNYRMDLWLERLDMFITEANQRGIYVMPVLLAKYPQDRFAPEDYTMALEQHVRPVVTHMAGKPGILAWDLFNEPDIGSPVDIRCWDWDNADFPLCFRLANERKQFIQAIHDEVKRLDPERLTTVGLAFAKNYFEPWEADLRLADVVDFYTFHYYDDDPYDSGRYAAHWYYGQGFPDDLQRAVAELAMLEPERPVVITELGFPTDAGSRRTPADLAHDLRRAQQTARAAGAGGILLWPFQDESEALIGDLYQ
ncbi:MAG: cellulase family glycosylhydrolase [Chloroflexaceae bacterium]